MVLSDRFKAALEALITKFTSKYEYAGMWGATVVSQNGDGTLELAPDRTDVLPGLSSVPIMCGIPGVTVTVQQGARCNVAFQNADPSKPFVIGWESHDLVSMSFTSGTAPFARVGDVVSVAFPPQVPFTGMVGGAPAGGVLVLAIPALGIIKSGNSQITG